MQPDEIEEMLYQRAIRTKIRAPQPERLANLGYNRVLTTGVVAGAALVCTLVMNSMSNPATAADAGAQKNQTNVQAPRHQNNTDPILASLAMSRIDK